MDNLDNVASNLEVLNNSLSDMNKNIETLNQKMSNSRKIVIGLGISVVFSLLLSVGLFFGRLQTLHALDKANQAAVAACETSNETATKEHQLWNGLISLTSKNNPPDPATLKAFNQLLDDTFVQRDC